MKRFVPGFIKTKFRDTKRAIKAHKKLKLVMNRISKSASLEQVNHILQDFSGRHSHPLGFKFILDYLETKQNPPLKILEFGSCGEGFLSTVFFNQYVKMFGYSLTSVDIDSTPRRRFKKYLKNTEFVVSDDILFARKLKDVKFDLVYFDSVSIDFINPVRSMIHHKELFSLVFPYLAEDAIVIFDDTPKTIQDISSEVDSKKAALFQKQNGYMPGKGTMIINEKKFSVLFWEYACILRRV